jgi:hypothetical protein
MSQPAIAASTPTALLRRAFNWWLAQVKHALPPTIFFFVGTKRQFARCKAMSGVGDKADLPVERPDVSLWTLNGLCVARKYRRIAVRTKALNVIAFP